MDDELEMEIVLGVSGEVPERHKDCPTCGYGCHFRGEFCPTCQGCSGCGKLRQTDSYLCSHHIQLILDAAAEEEEKTRKRKLRRERKAAARKALETSPLSCPQLPQTNSQTYSR
jgi:hypothetical protein